jgi:natural product biosynthesis luciferase-like monooxygenase protein
VDFGLSFFAADADPAGPPGRAPYDLLLTAARFADQHGLSAVWTPERHFHPFGGLYPNPSVTGAAIAAVTDRVGIRAGSVVVPLHHPVRIAEEWSVVDNLSRGRVGVSFASGWNRNDFLLSTRPYAERMDAFTSGMETVQALWRGDAVTLHDTAGEPYTPRIFPPPYQPELPTWVTTAGSRGTAEMAGRIGANLLTHLLGQGVAELAETIRGYRKTRDRAPGTGRVTLMLHTCLDDDHDRAVGLARQPLMGYLRSSFGLSAAAFARMGVDVGEQELTGDDWDVLLGVAADRYLSSNSLIGSVGHCGRLVEQLAEIGVDEIACLIDFGCRPDAVLAGLRHIATLQAAHR